MMNGYNQDFEISISDLNPLARERFEQWLESNGASVKEGNWDVIPIAYIPVPEQDE